MPRPKVILQNIYPYHVSARCINREWFNLPLDQVWEIMSRQLYFIHRAYNAQIHSFVLMSNHFHLLISTPESNLSDTMANFMRETSRFINEASSRINQAYGARHFRSIISSDHYYLHAYKYIYQNPIFSNLAERVEEYKYSSLRGKLGLEPLLFPVAEDKVLFEDVESVLKWLNTKPSSEDWKAVGLAMQRGEFKLSRNQSTKKESHLEVDML